MQTDARDSRMILRCGMLFAKKSGALNEKQVDKLKRHEEG